jgi:hypothetical protein
LGSSVLWAGLEVEEGETMGTVLEGE